MTVKFKNLVKTGSGGKTTPSNRTRFMVPKDLSFTFPSPSTLYRLSFFTTFLSLSFNEESSPLLSLSRIQKSGSTPSTSQMDEEGDDLEDGNGVKTSDVSGHFVLKGLLRKRRIRNLSKFGVW